jgi:hypothetical protein
MESFIAVFNHALSRDLCSEIVGRFDSYSSQQVPGRTGGGVDPKKKRSVDISLDSHSEWEELQSRVREQVFPCLCEYARRFHFLLVGALSPTVRHPSTGVPVTLDDGNFSKFGSRYVPQLLAHCFQLGAMNVQRYEAVVGGYPHWHSEIFPEPAGTEALRRVLFWLCYLNDVDTGGETKFAYQRVQIHPQQGRVLIAPAGFTHTHRGKAPLSGAKYVISSWLLYKQHPL